MKSSTKILIIIIIIIAVLAVAGTVFGFLYLKTDFFKSNEELFKTYISQEIENIKKVTQSNTYQVYKDIKSQNRYDSDTKINIKYSEGGEISNPFNDLSITIKAQKDNNYRYRDAQVLYQDDAYLGIEGIRDEDIYGIRFSNALKQFISVKNTQETIQNAEKFGLDAEMLQTCISIIDNDSFVINEIISEEEFKELKEKYFNIVINSFQNANYSNQRKAMITLNNATVETNSYSATLDSKQVQDLIEQLLREIKTDDILLNKIENYAFIEKETFTEKIDKILENLGIDEEIPSIKVTEYVKKGEVLRTTIEIGLNKITIENLSEQGQVKTKIQRSVLNDEQQEEQSIEIIKQETDNSENYNIKLGMLNGENEYTLEYDIQMQNNNGNIETTGNIKYIKGITKIEYIIENITKTTIGEKMTLDETNNVTLNDLDDATRENIINIVKTEVPAIINSRTQELLEKLEIQQFVQQMMSGLKQDGTKDEEQQPIEGGENPETEEPQMSKVEINRFNAKFEFYTGNEVTAENVKSLLDVVKTNLNSVNVSETGEIKLVIEKDKQNATAVNQVLEQIKDNKKYKVSISYKDSNGLIDYITINEVEEEKR